MQEKMYKIGELSKLTDVPVKTIRYYDELGLLAPSYVDRYTSYRYYDEANMEKLFQILLLKELGYSLAIDGSFGPDTRNKVKQFQKKMHLAVDGNVGPATVKALTE